ncbi:MAG: diaminopimelate epimerase [Deltaproteobacteria bacterium]|nr:diaminopimelate epimerase [Deltaproteobacteria bacterium]
MIEFFKMSGSGNDFILIDNWDGGLALENPGMFARALCTRKTSVGADGLILIEPSQTAAFRWRFFNADGSEAEMCGNGGRCAARFAVLRNIAGEELSFETQAGIIDAAVRRDMVKLRLTDPREMLIHRSILLEGQSFDLSSINTGVPHAVHIVNCLDRIDVFHLGRMIRQHESFQPNGTNANFVEIVNKHAIRVRTYERGVEDETLACGTGAVASVLICSWKGLVESPVNVRVRSGEVLRVYFRKSNDGFRNIYLEGKVKVIYQGLLWAEAYPEAG